MYCNVCSKYRKSEKTKISYIFKKTLFTVSAVMNKKKLFKEEQSIEILKLLDLMNNVEEYQKI